MTFVIDGSCCKDASCVEVCPAQCIHPRPGDPDFDTADQLYIDPGACIGCGACVIECPVGAISHESDLVGVDRRFLDTNALYFELHPTLEPVRPFDNGWIAGAPDREHVRIAIVGSGASGCYMAAELSDRGFSVDLFEKEDGPFGLIHEGVAPDHVGTKSIRHMFGSILRRRNVSVYGGVTVGSDISIARLRESYHAVIWAAGANLDRQLRSESRAMGGVFSGREFARWLNLDRRVGEGEVVLEGPSLAILGMGNVALDVARAVLNPASAYDRSSVPADVLSALRSASIREVRIVSRSAVERVSFSFSQLYSLLNLPNVQMYIYDMLRDDAPVQVDMRLAKESQTSLGAFARARRSADVDASVRRIVFQFNSRLIDIVGDGHLREVLFSASVPAVGGGAESGAEEKAPIEYPTKNLVIAIGQACEPSDPINDFKLDRAVPSIAMRAGFEDSYLRPGLYVIGWSRRNGHGVIGTGKIDARAVADHLVACLEGGQLTAPSGDRNVLTEGLRKIHVMAL